MRGIGFTAMLYCMALCGLFSGGDKLYTMLDWRYFSHPAMMVLADPKAKAPLLDKRFVRDMMFLDVKLIEPGNETLVPKFWLNIDHARRLFNGESIPVFFRRSNTHYVKYSQEEIDELDSPWGWLVWGVTASFVANFARKLVHREYGAG